MLGTDDGALRTTTRAWRDQLNALAAAAGPQHRSDALIAFEAASVDDAVGAIVQAGHLLVVPEAGGLGGLAGMPEPVVRREPIVVPVEPEVIADAAAIAAAETAFDKATHRLRRAEQRLDQAEAEVREAESARHRAAESVRRLKD